MPEPRTPLTPDQGTAARTRLARLPQPRTPIQLFVVFGVATLVLGFLVRFHPQFASAEFGFDQNLDRHRFSLLNVVALAINTVLSPPGILVILAVAFLLLLVVRHSPVNAVAVVALAGIPWLSSEVIKFVVSQPRPDMALLHHPLVGGDGSPSFPSGHTTFAAGFAVAVYFLARNTRWSKLALVVGIVFVLAVGASRLYLGVHYPSDVVGSVLLVATTTSLITWLWNRYGLQVLHDVPLIGRFGPIPPAPTTPRGVNHRRKEWLDAADRDATSSHE